MSCLKKLQINRSLESTNGNTYTAAVLGIEALYIVNGKMDIGFQCWKDSTTCDSGGDAIRFAFITGNNKVFSKTNSQMDSSGIITLAATESKAWLESITEIGSGNVQIL